MVNVRVAVATEFLSPGVHGRLPVTGPTQSGGESPRLLAATVKV
jgi:hypothetical protein